MDTKQVDLKGKKDTNYLPIANTLQDMRRLSDDSDLETPSYDKGRKLKRKRGSDDEEDPGDVESLNSDLDDDAEEPQTDDIVFCQFEKVSRVKTKHKCALKDGIMNLNGRDYLFSKATCEFEFYY